MVGNGTALVSLINCTGAGGFVKLLVVVLVMAIVVV